MQYLSVCSGIEAATVAWSPLGFEAVAFSEIDNFPAAVLAHHYPGVPNLGDMTKFKEWPDYEPDILVGGTPCQSFSVAGLRKGLADPRGNLMLTYLAIADRYQPEWIVWENVPGVLSSGSGRDFGTFLGALGQIGYGWAYRILDAQFFGVPQRRRRVFVVGHLGDWRRAAAVLFERHSLQRHPTPSRETGKGLAPCLSARTKGGGGLGTDFDLDGGLINAPAAASFWNGEQVTQTLDAVLAKGQMMPEKNRFPAVLVPDVTHSLRADGFDASEDGTGRGTPLVPTYCIKGAAVGRKPEAGPQYGEVIEDVSYTQNATEQHVVAIRTAQTSSNGCGISDEGTSYTLDGAQGQAVAVAFQSSQSGVRIDDTHATLDSNNGSRRHNGVVTGMRGDNRGSGIQVTGDQANTLHWAKGISEQQAVAVAVALRGREGGGTAELSEVPSALRASGGGGGDKAHVLLDTCYNNGINQGDYDARSQERDTGAILSRVQKEIGAQAFAEWGLGILDSLQTAKILQSALHGLELRPAPFTRSWVVYCALSREENRASGAMLSLLEACGERCPPQGWESLEQLSGELGAYLSELSLPGTQPQRFMCDLWRADEGSGILQQALSAVQKAWRPDETRVPNPGDMQDGGVRSNGSRARAVQQACPTEAPRNSGQAADEPQRTGDKAMAGGAFQVRRLTPLCCEFLQGFPRNYSLIPFTHGKPAADGPRYKALGNSMAVPVMRWIGERIQLVDWLHAND